MEEFLVDEIGISERMEKVREDIERACAKVGRDPSEVQLVAVTKAWPPEVANAAIRSGAQILGENRVQEALAKAQLCASAQWHLIGPLQRNKIRHALSLFTTIHSVDNIQLLSDIDRIQGETGTRPDLLLEVNVAGELTKHGFTPDTVRDAIRVALDKSALNIVGLMTMPPWVKDPEQSRVHFDSLRRLRDALESEFSISLPHLSMGTSSDYAVAVEEGATFVRVGTNIFGHRNASAWKPQRTPDSDSYF